MRPEKIELYQDRQLNGVPVMSFPRIADVVVIGYFPTRWNEHILLTETGLWTLWMYQGQLCKRKERG